MNVMSTIKPEELKTDKIDKARKERERRRERERKERSIVSSITSSFFASVALYVIEYYKLTEHSETNHQHCLPSIYLHLKYRREREEEEEKSSLKKKDVAIFNSQISPDERSVRMRRHPTYGDDPLTAYFKPFLRKYSIFFFFFRS